MMGDAWALAGLFATAFLAATVLPAQSELLLAGMQASGAWNAWALLAVASAGNILGSCANWLLGRGAARFQDRRWFPVKPAMLERAAGWYRRWGVWSLLLAWVPFVGDPLTVAAGMLRVGFTRFLVLVGIGKIARYAALLSVI